MQCSNWKHKNHPVRWSLTQIGPIVEHQTLTLHLLRAPNWKLPSNCYCLAALAIKAFVDKNNFSSGEKPPWLILRKHMLNHEHPAEGFQLQLQLVSGARLNLSKWEVKKQLVDHFHVLQEVHEVNVYRHCRSFYLRTLCQTREERINHPTVHWFALKTFSTFKPKAEKLHVIWLKGWVAKVMNAPIDPAGNQGRESTDSLITLLSQKPACAKHSTTITAPVDPQYST